MTVTLNFEVDLFGFCRSHLYHYTVKTTSWFYTKTDLQEGTMKRVNGGETGNKLFFLHKPNTKAIIITIFT